MEQKENSIFFRFTVYYFQQSKTFSRIITPNFSGKCCEIKGLETCSEKVVVREVVSKVPISTFSKLVSSPLSFFTTVPETGGGNVVRRFPSEPLWRWRGAYNELVEKKYVMGTTKEWKFERKRAINKFIVKSKDFSLCYFWSELEIKWAIVAKLFWLY